MSSYLAGQLKESLQVLDTCLECVYAGKHHMHRALAGQLRLLLCDGGSSLIRAVYPALEVSAMETINWSAEGAGPLRMSQTSGGTNRIAQMPFEITVYENGLEVADLLLSQTVLLTLDTWCDQPVTFHPTKLDIHKVIKAVADKGGGAHVDPKASPALALMRRRAVSERTYAELFIIALARFVQQIGEQLLKYEGCRVDQSLHSRKHHKYNLLVAAHRDLADA